MNGLLLALMMAGGIAPPPPPPPPEVQLSDIDRFPSESTVHETLRFINAHKAWVEQQHGLTWDECTYWQERCNDMGWRWYVWDDLRIIHETDNPETKLVVLRRVRDWIGVEHYMLGELPPPAPVWLFNVYDR